MEPQYSTISWKDFQHSTAQSFQNLWNDSHFTDVTLATADNRQINAHKVILSSCSTVFHNILASNPHQKPIIFFNDIDYTKLHLLLQYMYLGQCTVQQEDLEAFLAAGDSLRITGLQEEEAEDHNAADPPIKIHLKQPSIKKSNHSQPKTGEQANNLVKYKVPTSTDTIDEKVEQANYIWNMGELPLEVVLEEQTIQESNHKVKHIEDAEIVEDILEKYKIKTKLFGTPKKVNIEERLKQFEKPPSDVFEEILISNDNEDDDAKQIKENEVKSAQVNTEVVEEVKAEKRDEASKPPLFNDIDTSSNHKCNLCDYTGKLQTYLTVHMLNKHGKRLCQQCSFSARYESTIQSHVKSVHEHVMQNCQECEFQTSKEASMKIHILAKHEGATFACALCKYVAKNPPRLMQHIQAHALGYKFQCVKCFSKQKDQSALTRHIREEHKGVTRMRNQCSWCDHRTADKSGLERHVRSHHPNK